MPDVTVVAELGTGLVRTRILDLGGGRFVWERRAGEDRGAPLPVPADAARRAVDGAAAGGVRPVLPTADGDVRLYPVPGAFSAARLLHQPAPAVFALLVEALRGTGATLAALHACPAPAGLPRTPPALERLTAWLDGPPDPFASAARARLGPGRWERARAWCTAAAGTDGVEEPVLLHGAPGLGLLVPGLRPGVAGLVCGEDLAAGPRAWDVGWLLGELLELRLAAARGLGSAPRVDYDALVAAVRDGYGTPPANAAVDRVATLRILLHARDYGAHVGWHDDLLGYADVVAELLDA